MKKTLQGQSDRKKIDERTKTRIASLVCSQPPEACDIWILELIQGRIIQDGLVKSIFKESIRIILKGAWPQTMAAEDVVSGAIH